MGFAIRGVVLALDECGFLTPDEAVSFITAEEVLLVVGRTEDVVTRKAQDKYTCSLRYGELDGVVDQVKSLSKKQSGSTIVIAKYTNILPSNQLQT